MLTSPLLPDSAARTLKSGPPIGKPRTQEEDEPQRKRRRPTSLLPELGLGDLAAPASSAAELAAPALPQAAPSPLPPLPGLAPVRTADSGGLRPPPALKSSFATLAPEQIASAIVAPAVIPNPGVKPAGAPASRKTPEAASPATATAPPKTASKSAPGNDDPSSAPRSEAAAPESSSSRPEAKPSATAASAEERGEEKAAESREPATPSSAASSTVPGGATSSGGAPTPRTAPGLSGAAEPAASPEAGAPETAAEGNEPAAEAPPEPDRDAGLQVVLGQVRGAGASQRAHGPPEAKAAEASAAAQGPPGEVAAMASARQVGVMDQQEAPPFNRQAFITQLTGRIEDVTPKNLEEADNFKENDRVGSLMGTLTSVVGQITGSSAGNVAAATQAAPNPAGIEPKSVAELAPAAKSAAPVVPTESAVPAPAAEHRISMAAESQRLDDQMTEGGVTREQIEKSNEPEFHGALAAKDSAQEGAAAAPGQYRAAEQQTLDSARGENAAAVSQQMGEMAGVRGQALGSVLGQQGGQKSEDEAKRAEVTQAIQALYDQAKTDVETRLAKLDTDVNARFDSAAQSAQAAFESYVDGKMTEYKDKRYSGLDGKALWVVDKLTGMPDEVNAFYRQGKEQYIATMKSSINDIATLVESGLLEAKARIASGKKQVEDYVQSQPKELQQIAKQAAGKIGAQFDQLEQGVNDKQNQIVDGLVARYQENLKALDERIDKLKEENKGFIDSAFDAMTGVIQTVGELAATLRGLLAKIGDVVMAIIADPIGFLDNLVTGVSTGLKNFVGNIVGHMKEGFFAWLFGAMAAAGITLPAQWDLKGVFGLLMQILGATYNFIRARAVSLVGEKVVSTIESTATFFKKLATEGPISLWEDLKEQVGSLVETTIDGIKTFLTETVIKAGIQWLLSLLTPASAFVKAAKTIIDIVTFIFTRGKQVMELVTAIVDSIAAIAKGSLGAAAQFVEKSLAKALPVAIGFLASLLGLGGLTERIQKLMAQLQKPVMKAIDWLISKIIGLAKSGLRRLGFEKETDKPDPVHDKALAAGVTYLAEKAEAAKEDETVPISLAEKIAKDAKSRHPVFKSISVNVTGDNLLVFEYTGSHGSVVISKIASNSKIKKETDKIAERLRALTARVRLEMLKDPTIVLDNLSEKQKKGIARRPTLVHAFFGTALHSQVAASIDNDRTLSKILEPTPYRAPRDFTFTKRNITLGYEITVESDKSVAKHLRRPAVHILVTYESIPDEFANDIIKMLGRKKKD